MPALMACLVSSVMLTSCTFCPFRKSSPLSGGPHTTNTQGHMAKFFFVSECNMNFWMANGYESLNIDIFSMCPLQHINWFISPHQMSIYKFSDLHTGQRNTLHSLRQGRGILYTLLDRAEKYSTLSWTEQINTLYSLGQDRGILYTILDRAEKYSTLSWTGQRNTLHSLGQIREILNTRVDRAKKLLDSRIWWTEERSS